MKKKEKNEWEREKEKLESFTEFLFLLSRTNTQYLANNNLFFVVAVLFFWSRTITIASQYLKYASECIVYTHRTHQYWHQYYYTNNTTSTTYKNKENDIQVKRVEEMITNFESFKR